MRWLLWLFPPRWRRRYGEEVGQLLEASDRPLADGLDLVNAAARAWLDRTSILVGAVLLAVAGAISTAWAAHELAGGAAELPRHWWSSLATLALLAGLVLTALAARARVVSDN